MPTAPAALGRLAEGLMGRAARVVAVREPAPGFVEVELDAKAPPGGWRPGHEVQFRATPTQARRYTVRSVAGGGLDGGGSGAERITLLAATAAGGPGTEFLRRLRPGDRTTAMAGRHRPLRERGTRRLYAGDGSALGTLDALAALAEGSPPVVVVEVPAAAVTWAAETRPGLHVLAEAPGGPGEAVRAWLQHALHQDGFADLDGAVLLGQAAAIQAQRRVLSAAGWGRGACTARAYWAEGRRGL